MASTPTDRAVPEMAITPLPDPWPGPAQNVQPVPARYDQIDQDQVVGPLVQQPDGGGRVGGGGDFQPFLFQDAGAALPHGLFVIDDEDPFRSDRGRAFATYL
jgi:hypothetical protein